MMQDAGIRLDRSRRRRRAEAVVNLVMCADDFGRSAAIDDAIVELAERGRLGAATVMVGEAKLWRSCAALKRVGTIEIGLHVVLSGDVSAEGRATLSGGYVPRDIDGLTRAALLRRLPLDRIALEVAAQFDEFERVFGHAPHFVDGHQHCHVLPGIREIVLLTAAQRSPSCWVRSCEESLASLIRRGVDRGRALRSAVLSRGMRASTRALGLRANDGFAGLYDLRDPLNYHRRLPRFMDHASGPNHLVICHPARAADSGDAIGPARVAEYDFLSRAPIELLAADRGLSLGTFR